MLRNIVFLSCFLCAPVSADLTIRGTHYPGISGGVVHQVTYLRENEMRVDQLSTSGSDDGGGDGIDSSVVIRFFGHPPGLLYLDHESKRVQIISSLQVATTDSALPSVKVVKRDETRELLGHTAHRYDFSFSGDVDPLAIFGEQLPVGLSGSIILKLQVTGTSWVVPGLEGADELAGFFDKLHSRQITIGMLGQSPSLATQELSLLSPGLSSSLTEVFRQITAIGFPLQTNTQSEMSVDMAGAMAGFIQGMLDSMGISGPQSTETITTEIQTGNVEPELFFDGKLPEGYSLNTP